MVEHLSWQSMMLSASHHAAAAICDMTEVVRDNRFTAFDNVGSGETLAILVDALRLFMEATVQDDQSDDGQLYAAVVKWMSDRSGIDPIDGEPM